VNEVHGDSKLKVLKVNGKSPGDKEYPLR
jgi:hypothetical protein